MPDPIRDPHPPDAPPRPHDGHKGTFGTVIVVGGSTTMPHAPAICGRAALRAGCGLLKIATQADVLAAALLTEPSATGIVLAGDGRREDPLTRLDRADPAKRCVLAVGPGMGEAGQGIAGERFVVAMLQGSRPIVVDADGLNLLAGSGQRHAAGGPPCVLTPHPGEFQRLAKVAGIRHDPTDPEQRVEAAVELARFHAAVVALKGRHTVVTDGQRVFVNDTGNPVLATAGTGDVLTGVIASLMAQGMPAYEAAALGVHLHGSAADEWARRRGRAGLLARELADELPEALETYRVTTEPHPGSRNQPA
ncbi:MAG: NAD(P)H-hydrate dehydratase [Phycisphaeraceae bacterium]